jgi:hypothetical protein
VDSAELLAATEATSDFVFDPRCLGDGKPIACLYRTASMILFEARDFDHRIVQALRKFCINSTNTFPEHPAPLRVLSKPGWEASIGKATIGAGRRRCAEASREIWKTIRGTLKVPRYHDRTENRATCMGKGDERGLGGAAGVWA